MRLPNRKPGKYTWPQFDPPMTEAALQELQSRLEQLKRKLPQAIHDTQAAGEHGDFSENAEYQIAKGRLRGLNRAVAELQYQINQAIIIQAPTDATAIQVGHTVKISTKNTEHTFKILGSTETNPGAGIISYKSPLGAMLMGHKVGEKVTLHVGEQTVEYEIMGIH